MARTMIHERNPKFRNGYSQVVYDDGIWKLTLDISGVGNYRFWVSREDKAVVNKYMTIIKFLDKKGNIRMRLITIQNYKVAEYLRHHNKFVVPDDVHWSDNLIAPYKFMMKHYNYAHRPIFYGAVGHNANLGGAKTEDSVILELDVPDIYCKIQDYYNWSDFIYFTELPEEWEEWHAIKTVKQFGHWTLDLYKNGFTGSSDTCYQVTTCFMMKGWIKNIVKMTPEFGKMFVDNGGNAILHSTLR